MLKKIFNRIRFTSKSLSWRIRNWTYRVLLERLKLSYRLPSGIEVIVSSMADWAIYNDVFVAGEYDVPIRAALGVRQNSIRILDLGANVGLFAKRALHLRRTEFPDVTVEFICVEGAPQTFADMQRQLPDLLAGESVQMLQGLAGKKSGFAVLATNPFHAMTGLARRAGVRGVQVDFINLCEATRKWPEISLLKCDIEGSEQLVVENYRDLLEKVTMAVFEFHLDRVDRLECVQILNLCGLTHRKVFHENHYISVEFFTR